LVSRFDRGKRKQTDQRTDKWLRELLADYVNQIANDGTHANKAHFDAVQQVDDLAFHVPETFWRFLELALSSGTDLRLLGDIGWGPLTLLLRRHPDDFVERVAGFARRDARMRELVSGIEMDRIAPDVWRAIELAIDAATPANVQIPPASE
jgi:hypothetical protein